MLPQGQQPVHIGHEAVRAPKSVWAQRKREKYLTKPTTAYGIWSLALLGLWRSSSVFNIHNSFDDRMGTLLQEEEYWQHVHLLSYVIKRVLQIRNDLQSQNSNSERFQRRNSALTENQIEILWPSARSQVTILAELPHLWKV
jgi:hypothetical protein